MPHQDKQEQMTLANQKKMSCIQEVLYGGGKLRSLLVGADWFMTLKLQEATRREARDWSDDSKYLGIPVVGIAIR